MDSLLGCIHEQNHREREDIKDNLSFLGFKVVVKAPDCLEVYGGKTSEDMQLRMVGLLRSV